MQDSQKLKVKRNIESCLVQSIHFTDVVTRLSESKDYLFAGRAKDGSLGMALIMSENIFYVS